MHKLLRKILNFISHLLPLTWIRKLSYRQRLFFWMVVGAFFVVVLPFVVAKIFFPEQSKAAWFDENFLYRQVANISNSNSTQLTDFQVALTIDTASLISSGKMQANCNDIRITDQDGNILPFWVEEGSADCGSSATKIWTKVPSIATSGASVFFYYGNQQAVASASSGLTTFDFFDDFNKGQLDNSKWAATGATSFSNGSLNVTTGSVYTQNTVARQPNQKIEARAQWTSSGTSTFSGLSMADVRGTAGSNATSSKVAYLTRGSSGNTTVYAYAGDGSVASYNIINGGSQFSSSNSTNYILSMALSSTELFYYRNRVQMNSYTGTWSASGYIFLGYILGANGGTSDIQDMSVDWVLSRKYAATEPTVSFGSEEKSPSPVAYWAMDEGTGNVASSSGSTSLPAGLYNGPTWQPESQCVVGKCLYFDGTNDYVNVSYNSILNQTSALTLGAWFKTSTTGTVGIVNRYNTSGSFPGYGISMTPNYGCGSTAGTLGFWVGDNTNKYLCTTNTFNDNKWHYVTGVYNGTTAYLYVDGILQTSAARTASLSTTSNLVVGARPGPVSYFPGFIDEVKIYPFALSADQVRANYNSLGGLNGSGAVLGAYDNANLSNGLVGYWKMDESSWTGNCSTTDIIDSSGNGNNGRACPNGAAAEATPSAKFGNAGYFNGTSTYAQVTHPSSGVLDFGTGDMTISSWIKFRSLANAMAWIGKNFTGSGAGYGMRLNSSLQPTFWLGNGTASTEIAYPQVLAAGQWYNIIGVRKDGVMTIYLNGMTGSTTGVQASSVSNTGALQIGSRLTSLAFCDCSIDELRMYNRALDPMEVNQLYNFAPGPVGYWDFEEGQGSVVNDKSTYGNNGMWTGTGSKWGIGKYGKGGNFNGTDAFVNLSSNTIFDANNRYTTASFWMNTATGSSVGVPLAKGAGGGGGWGIFHNADGTITAVFKQNSSNAVTRDTVKSYPRNTWIFVSVVMKVDTSVLANNDIQIYINGVLDQGSLTASLVPTLASAIGLKIGARATSNGTELTYYSGKVDEVRVYNYARTTAQIISDMQAGAPSVTSKSMVGYWDMDEGAGSVVGDRSPQRINGTMSGQTWSQNGKYGKALFFNGNGNVALASAAPYQTDSKTVSFWANPSAAPAGFQGIFYGGLNWYVGMHTSNRIFVSYGNSSNAQTTAASSNNTVIPGEWHYYSVVFSVLGNDVTRSFYRDGKLINSSSASTGYGTSYSSVFYLGGFSTVYYNGLLDEVKVYNSALTAQDIKADFNRGSSLVLGSFGMDSSGVASNSASALYCVPGSSEACAAPVGEWNFDDRGAATVADTSGNNNNGTWAGSGTRYAPGKIGSSGSFNGTNDSMQIAQPSIQTSPNLFTFTGFIKPTDHSSFFITPQSAGTDQFISYDGPNKRIRLNIAETTDTNIRTRSSTVGSVPPNAWTYFAVSINDKNVKIFINGMLNAEFNESIDIAGWTSNWSIGQRGNSTNWYQGQMDQLRVYNYARTTAQVAWEYSNGKPVAKWKLDECQGPTAYDVSGFGNNGTIQIGSGGTQTTVGTCQNTNSAAAWYNGRVGKWNSSLNFDGTDDFVNTGNSLNPSASTGWSMSAWVKSASGSVDKAIMGWWDGTNGIFMQSGHSPEAAGDGFLILAGDATDYGGASFVSAGTWVHVALIYDGSLSGNSNRLKLFINGTQKTLTFNSGANIPSAIPTLSSSVNSIGKLTSSTRYWNGQIDDAQVFNYPLTPIQVKNVYNQSSAVRFGPLTGSP